MALILFYLYKKHRAEIICDWIHIFHSSIKSVTHSHSVFGLHTHFFKILSSSVQQALSFYQEAFPIRL